MSAPSKRAENQVVKIHCAKGQASQAELNFALEEVTNPAKPKGRMSQAVMQMNGLSPVIFIITEADAVHLVGRQYQRSRHGLDASGSVGVLDNGMIQDGCSMNLGDPAGSSAERREYARTSRKRRGLADGTQEVGSVRSTRSLGKPGTGGRDRQSGNRMSAGMAAPQRVA
jgi:hypothetical protein